MVFWTKKRKMLLKEIIKKTEKGVKKSQKWAQSRKMYKNDSMDDFFRL